MNQFTIFYFLALFCPPFASAQPERKMRGKINEASIYNKIFRSSQTFNNEDMYLYELIDGESTSPKCYVVGDGSADIGPKFPMTEYNVAVTDDRIIIKYIQYTITLTLDEDTFEFHRDLFSLGEFPHRFYPAEIYLGEQKFDIVAPAIKAKDVGPGEWLFAIVEGNTPRLIFPRRFLPATSIENSAAKVSFVCEPMGEKMTVEFSDPADASAFYNFVKSPFLYQQQSENQLT